MFYFQNINELKTLHLNKVNRTFSLGLTVQPFVVYVGGGSFDKDSSNTSLSFYAVINEIYFKVETILKAFDVCFKSFYTLNLQYPFEAEQVWHFIQVYLYEYLESRVEKKFLGVKSLIKDLNNL